MRNGVADQRQFGSLVETSFPPRQRGGRPHSRRSRKCQACSGVETHRMPTGSCRWRRDNILRTHCTSRGATSVPTSPESLLQHCVPVGRSVRAAWLPGTSVQPALVQTLIQWRTTMQCMPFDSHCCVVGRASATIPVSPAIPWTWRKTGSLPDVRPVGYRDSRAAYVPACRPVGGRRRPRRGAAAARPMRAC